MITVQRLRTIIDGDPSIRLAGMGETLEHVEVILKELVADTHQIRLEVSEERLKQEESIKRYQKNADLIQGLARTITVLTFVIATMIIVGIFALYIILPHLR